MEKVKEYLKMEDVFYLPVESKIVDICAVGKVDDFKLLDEYATHAINSHDELVNQRNELLKALEAHEKFWVIRESELGELSPEARAVRDAGLIVITKTKGSAA